MDNKQKSRELLKEMEDILTDLDCEYSHAVSYYFDNRLKKLIKNVRVLKGLLHPPDATAN
jgi:hypothetical protein